MGRSRRAERGQVVHRHRGPVPGQVDQRPLPRPRDHQDWQGLLRVLSTTSAATWPIREYNAEYDRLHARLREVGCSLPEDCAAWLYVDRLQLEESAELNLLASVGNSYSLHKLQKAAVIQDRGLRKPWEGSGGRGKKTHTAHFTGHDEGDTSGSDARERTTRTASQRMWPRPT